MNAQADLSYDYAYGRSLPQRFYCDANVCADDIRFLGDSQWILADHGKRIPEPGDYFLFQFGPESVIVLRDRNENVRAFYNVCRHRGSIICSAKSGQLAALTCPYHAWTYDLTGRLVGAAYMPADFDKATHSLRTAYVKVEDGLIFLNLSATGPPSFEEFIHRHRPYLRVHDLQNTKIAVRRTYPTVANWKLVVENFSECYHCGPAHPTFSSVHSAQRLLSLGAGRGSSSHTLSSRYRKELAAWDQLERQAGRPAGVFGDGPESPFFQGGGRTPIKSGYMTESVGGKPVAPLMGAFAAFDGSRTVAAFNPISYLIASNDHAVVLSFVPRDVLYTEVIASWLVHSDAEAGRDYDESDLTRVWDVTLREDKVITENNQLGVASRHYQPGRHSLVETRVSDFVSWYMCHRHPELSPSTNDEGSSRDAPA